MASYDYDQAFALEQAARSLTASGNASRRSNASYVKMLASDGLASGASVSGAAIMGAAFASCNIEMLEVMSLIAVTYAKSIKARKGSFKSMYNEIGRTAIEAVTSAYSSIDHGTEGPYRSSAPDPYNRFSGGKLISALSSKQMYRASYDGLEFINQPFLDKNARQWKRLQYGAGPAKGYKVHGRNRPSATRMVFFGKSVGTLGLKGAVQPNFNIPIGVFNSEGFTPISYAKKQSEKAKKLKSNESKSVRAFGAQLEGSVRRSIALPADGTRYQRGQAILWPGGPSRSGIAAQHFLDAGVSMVAKLAPAGNERLITLLAQEALEAGTGPLAQAAIDKGNLEAIRRLSETTARVVSSTNKRAREIDRFLDSVKLQSASGVYRIRS